MSKRRNIATVVNLHPPTIIIKQLKTMGTRSIAWFAFLFLAATSSQAQESNSQSSRASATSVVPTTPTATAPATSSATPTTPAYLASCPSELELQISICLDTVARDGAVLPCNPDDWWCNCNNWQGIISCYQPCPDLQEQADIDWNQNNCQGQHGFANLLGGNSTGSYLGSNITTTGSNGHTRSYYSEMPQATSTIPTSTWSWQPTASPSGQARAKSAASHQSAVKASLLAIPLVLATASSLVYL